jgi:hypothetical protein
MTGFYAHHPSLAKASQKAGSTASEVSSSADHLSGVTSEAVSENSGWASSGALGKCLTAWQKRIRDLSYEVQTIGQNLGECNAQYQKADQKLVSRLNQLATEIQNPKE